MHEDTCQSDRDSERGSLETADAVARAAHMWVRSLYSAPKSDESERQALAGGLVAGLCERLELDARVTNLVAYVYALLDQNGNQALPISRFMLQRPEAARHREAFRKGRKEAAAIVEMLASYRRH